jgi:hypothetical protein
MWITFQSLDHILESFEGLRVAPLRWKNKTKERDSSGLQENMWDGVGNFGSNLVDQISYDDFSGGQGSWTGKDYLQVDEV